MAEEMTQVEALKGLPRGSKGVNLREKKTAYATERHPYQVEGSEVIAHPLLMTEFEKKGYVTLQKSGKK